MGEQQTGPEDAATAARCTTCGAVPTPAAPASPGAEGADTATETHCEWCGAEYPVPGAA